MIPWVFHRNGKRILDFRGAWKVAFDPAGIDRTPQDFRRTAVRRLERAGVARSVAMKLTGHKTESVRTRYATVSESDLREGVAKMASLPACGEAGIEMPRKTQNGDRKAKQSSRKGKVRAKSSASRGAHPGGREKS